MDGDFVSVPPEQALSNEGRALLSWLDDADDEITASNYFHVEEANKEADAGLMALLPDPELVNMPQLASGPHVPKLGGVGYTTVWPQNKGVCRVLFTIICGLWPVRCGCRDAGRLAETRSCSMAWGRATHTHTQGRRLTHMYVGNMPPPPPRPLLLLPPDRRRPHAAASALEPVGNAPASSGPPTVETAALLRAVQTNERTYRASTIPAQRRDMYHRPHARHCPERQLEG